MRSHDDHAAAEERPRDHATRRDDHPDLLAQRALEHGRTGALDAGAVAHLQRTAGNAVVGSGGQGLDDRTRTDMESSFGHDFGGVRVHTDAAASSSAEAVRAQAYTVGDDIVFRSGSYQPGTPSGRHLLSHELTHVVQQRSGPVDGTPTTDGISLSDPSDRFEQAADEVADELDEP